MLVLYQLGFAVFCVTKIFLLCVCESQRIIQMILSSLGVLLKVEKQADSVLKLPSFRDWSITVVRFLYLVFFAFSGRFVFLWAPFLMPEAVARLRGFLLLGAFRVLGSFRQVLALPPVVFVVPPPLRV